ncbi:MAG: hypothetical protein BJ554DRAFT_2624, partial [Olpidium bornovanus]
RALPSKLHDGSPYFGGPHLLRKYPHVLHLFLCARVRTYLALSTPAREHRREYKPLSVGMAGETGWRGPLLRGGALAAGRFFPEGRRGGTRRLARDRAYLRRPLQTFRRRAPN